MLFKWTTDTEEIVFVFNSFPEKAFLLNSTDQTGP